MLEILLYFVFAVVIGLMFTFFGYPLFRFLLPVWAFLVGFMFGFRGLEDLLGVGFVSASLGIILGFVVGVVLAAIAYMVYSLAVYLFGLTTGYVLGSGLMLAMGFDPGAMTFLVGAVAAIGLAVIFARGNMPRFFIMLVTASSGAMAVMSGIFVLFGRVPALEGSLELARYMVWGSWFWLLVWAILAGFGMVFQYAIAMTTDGNLNEVYVWEREYTQLKPVNKKSRK